MDQRARAATEQEAPGFVETIGANLRRYRNQRGLTGAELGSIVGTSGSQISKYENGEDRIAADRLLACARALQAPIECFYEGLDGIEPESERAELALIHRAAGELIALPEPFRSQVVDIIQSLRRTVLDLAADAAFRSPNHA
jgi:transcriptional regulator with XRE-family HTH domain